MISNHRSSSTPRPAWGKVKERYHKPATPCDRLLAHPSVSNAAKEAIRAEQPAIDPLELYIRSAKLNPPWLGWARATGVMVRNEEVWMRFWPNFPSCGVREERVRLTGARPPPGPVGGRGRIRSRRYGGNTFPTDSRLGQTASSIPTAGRPGRHRRRPLQLLVANTHGFDCGFATVGHGRPKPEGSRRVASQRSKRLVIAREPGHKARLPVGDPFPGATSPTEA